MKETRSLGFRVQGFPKNVRGASLWGVSIIRIVLVWGLYLGLPFCGKLPHWTSRLSSRVHIPAYLEPHGRACSSMVHACDCKLKAAAMP